MSYRSRSHTCPRDLLPVRRSGYGRFEDMTDRDGMPPSTSLRGVSPRNHKTFKTLSGLLREAVVVFTPGAKRHSPHPDQCGDEIDEAFEVDCSAVVSCCEASEVLHSVEAPFDAVAIFVGSFIVGDDDLARPV